ncbi:hypothetical protein [Spiroplasma endosymbiont of Stenodema calcarata]|uniref:hypothetical protein n=1 Tax=Spiroplasma endosymbiont of Stenodema calcarata TaxID=3139328 RepID=UPI0030DF9AC0
MILSITSDNITYLAIMLFGIIVGTLLLIVWIIQKRRLANSGDYYAKNNTKLDLWTYIKRNIALYGAFFCYVIGVSALFLMVAL